MIRLTRSESHTAWPCCTQWWEVQNSLQLKFVANTWLCMVDVCIHQYVGAVCSKIVKLNYIYKYFFATYILWHYMQNWESNSFSMYHNPNIGMICAVCKYWHTELGQQWFFNVSQSQYWNDTCCVQILTHWAGTTIVFQCITIPILELYVPCANVDTLTCKYWWI